MKPNKPLYLQLEIDGYQEDKIVAVSLAESFKQTKCDKHEWPEDVNALRKALKLVYHYYTGRNLK